MTAPDVRRAALPIYLLVALAVLVLLLGAGAPIHLHHADAPGLYNGECLLAALAAFHGVATLPLLLASLSTAPVVGVAAVHATTPVCGLLVRLADPRAPPLA